MDQIINAGKSFFQNQGQGGNEEQYGGQGGQQNYGQGGQQQGGYGQQGSEQYNSNNNGGGGGGFDIGDIGSLVSHAQGHDQQQGGNQSSDLFSTAASFLQGRQSNVSGDVDEQQLMQNHEKVNNSDQSAHSSEIGNAAALSAIKNVLGGGGSGGGNLQSQLIGAAMAQAGQLFDQKSANGQVSGGDKQSAVNQAGEMVMKLMIKHQMSGMIGGGQSGGISSLLKLVG